MKPRFSFVLLAVLLTVFLVVGLLPSSQTQSATLAASATPTPFPAPTEAPPPFVPFPTRLPFSLSPTSLPLQSTYTSIPAETPDVLSTPTLLPIDTPTLQMVGSETLLPVPTQTLVFFATMTSTPNGGTATPPVPVAYALDEKPRACYKGSSLAYIQLDTFKIARIVGKDITGKWWFLLVYKGQGVYVSCWVSGDQVATGGNLASLSVTEPELSQITQVKLTLPGQPATGAEYVQTIACDEGLTNTTLHFRAQIFTDGPLDDLGYIWTTDAPAQFQTRHTPVKAWDAPAQVDVDLPVPSQPGSYTLSLRTTFPAEVLGRLRFIVGCK